MKAIIIVVLSILLAAILIVGNIQWRKTSSSYVLKSLYFNVDNSSYLGFAKAWPENSQTQFELKLQNNDTSHIILFRIRGNQ